jgi:hypothetical protein
MLLREPAAQVAGGMVFENKQLANSNWQLAKKTGGTLTPIGA